jgi:hypothetical protein
MIERLKDGGDKAFGLKVTGRVTAAEVEAFLPQLEFAIKDRGKRTLGILADLSGMQGAEWKARWDEIKFLSKYSEHIARVAVVGAGKWEDAKAEILAGTVLIQAETRYYQAPTSCTPGAGSRPAIRARRGSDDPPQGQPRWPGCVPEYSRSDPWARGRRTLRGVLPADTAAFGIARVATASRFHALIVVATYVRSTISFSLKCASASS